MTEGLYQQKCSKICKQNLRSFCCLLFKFSLTQLTVTKRKRNSHFLHILRFTFLLFCYFFSFKITFSFHFKTLTGFCVSHPTKHTMINISVYIFIYIYYTIKFLFVCVSQQLYSFIYLSSKKKIGRRET